MLNISEVLRLAQIRHSQPQNISQQQLDSFLRQLAAKRDAPKINVTDVMVSFKDASEHQVTQILRRYGVVCLTGAVKQETTEKACRDLEILCQQMEENRANSGATHGRILNGVWQQENVYASTMQEFCDYPKPIINIRGNRGIDGGMLDMFNIDRMRGLASSELMQCFEAVKSEKVRAAIKTHSPFRFSTHQVYRNHSVTNTRGFHIDNLLHTCKVFLYLTDVDHVEQGPYCYIPGSHRIPYVHRLELRLTEKMGADIRDIWSSKYLKQLPFLAPAGTLIISDQSGIHRGLPQSEGESRTVVVGNYNRHRLKG